MASSTLSSDSRNCGSAFPSLPAMTRRPDDAVAGKSFRPPRWSGYAVLMSEFLQQTSDILPKYLEKSRHGLPYIRRVMTSFWI